MRRTSVATVLAILVLLALGGATIAQPVNYLYETYFVGAAPAPGVTSNEIGVVSAWETNQGGGGTFTGWIFADYGTATLPANAIHAAALDSSDQRFLSGVLHSTGSLVVAKNWGGWPGFETYSGQVPVGSPAFHPTNGAVTGTQEMYSTSLPLSFPTVTASLNRVDAMDIGNGYLWGGVMAPTDFVITAETFQNTIWLGAYTLTNNQGLAIQPFLVNAQNSTMPGPCLGLTTSNGKAGLPPFGGPFTRNDVVFVDSAGVAHAMYFDIMTQAFGLVDANVPFQVPWILPGFNGSIAGIWICQNGSVAVPSHNIGISIPSLLGGPGTFCILTDTLLYPPGAWRVTMPGFGGGPICHIPTGAAQPSQASPSFWALVGQPPTIAAPYGWYVATPPAVGGGGPWTLEAVDCNGTRPGLFIHNYSPGFQPNGTPLSDPGGIGFLGNPALQPGLVWVPEVNPAGAGTYQIQLVRGAPIGPLLVGTVFHQVAANNHPTIPALPALLLAGQGWQCRQILQDQKTNSKADYGLYAGGY